MGGREAQGENTVAKAGFTDKGLGGPLSIAGVPCWGIRVAARWEWCQVPLPSHKIQNIYKLIF